MRPGHAQGNPTTPSPGDRPRIRHNDYSPLVPPPLGRWSPELRVSVVVPAHGGQHRLDLTLAALAAQTYPAGLMEVIVVDDGSDPPLRLPEKRPENTRLVTAAPGGWGIAHALNTGAHLAEGEIIQRLDADMVISREHIEALMRWHHLTDYVVTIGAKVFVEEPALTAAQVNTAVGQGGLDSLFDMAAAVPSSTEATIRRLDGLRASKNPYHVCTGPTVSLRRALFHEVGGLDPSVPRGEDTEFAYRLAMTGAVFVPDMEARAVHLGIPAQRVDTEATVRVVAPYLAHRVPLRRDLRKERGRRWLVPYAEVVLDVRGRAEPEVRAAVGAALGGSLPDVAVTLLGPWSALPEGRRRVLDDPDFEARLIHEQFRHDDAVRLADEPTPDPAPVPFRYTGSVDVPLGRRSLELMIKSLNDTRAGLLVVEFPGGGTARLERTEATNRARLLAAPGEDLTDVIAQTHGVRRAPSSDFWPPDKPKAKPAPATPEPAAPAHDRPSATRNPAERPTPRPTPQGTPEKLVKRLRTALRGR
ncbi:glycosyltransferase [Sphaerisporangium album]|uniref:Glycosyltransferase n=1 Tax=Sphaerisporangium album TaxID=509200 RepID=A0A367FKI3_9ACTN|nr:glycosyltransferase [Sphaerisporangium album]